ncbi:unnamed protein product [Caenorhabditis brenneri]
MSHFDDPPFLFNDFHPFPTPDPYPMPYAVPYMQPPQLFEPYMVTQPIFSPLEKFDPPSFSPPPPMLQKGTRGAYNSKFKTEKMIVEPRKRGKKWTALKVECERAVNKVKELDNIFRLPNSKEDIMKALDITAKIFSRREEIFKIADASPPSIHKREVLSLLRKLRSLEEDSLIGKAVMVFNPDNAASKEKLEYLQQLRDQKEKDLKTREIDAQNFFKAFHMTYAEMAHRAGQGSSQVTFFFH